MSAWYCLTSGSVASKAEGITWVMYTPSASAPASLMKSEVPTKETLRKSA
jgi:hypothetical protein